MKLIDLHKKWCEKGKIKDRYNSNGSGGLCNAVPVKYVKAVKELRPRSRKAYWASPTNNMYSYGSLRQTIVLLICAMNNEL